MKGLLSILLFLCGTASWAAGTTAGAYHVDLVTDPVVLPVGKATLVVKITDASGKPVAGAQVNGIAQMPGMPMGERDQTALPGDQPGTYRIPASFAMAGGYEAKISISGPLGNATATIPMETGKSTAAGEKPSFPFSMLIWIALGLTFLAFVVYRMRRTGQPVDVRPLFSGRVIATIAVFAIILAGSIFVVNHFRRPGSMTPVEAQTMEMNTPAPEGVTPVTLATAEMKPFAPTVRYSGQVVGFVEQDVYPRVTGTIVWMPYYVGDSVVKGEVLARLDTSQTLPQLSDRAAGLRSAESGVGAAQAEYRQALAGVSEAEAEHGQHEGMVEEMDAGVTAAKGGRDSAQAQVVAATSDVENARANLTSAQADQVYWTDELKRESGLLASGAVSTDEYQKEKAEAAKSDAAVRGGKQGVATAQAKLSMAQAQKRQADAIVLSSQKKLAEARSELSAHHAHVEMAKATAASAKSRIDQALAAVAAAESQLQSATATEGYAEIRAESDGVITKRFISPGVLVNPGQAILKVAQIQPIRVQANVPEADLDRIRVGAMVQVSHRDTGDKSVTATVSSVSPSLDPSARTGIVEAVLPNADKAFMPGQFVSMDISTAKAGNALVIPASGLQTEVQPSESGVISTAQKHFAWVATPVQGKPESFSVARVDVEIGRSSGESVVITRGLAQGQQVVTSGAEYLHAGQTVTSTDSTTAATSSSPTVEITEEGFVPPSVTIKAGRPTSITFVRKTDNTCAKEVVFPTLKLTRPLPLNARVTIDLPSQPEGELSYVCGMNMLHGKVVVR